MIIVNENEEAVDAFDKYPNREIAVRFPGSGSWYEAFRTKDEYLDRIKAWKEYTDHVKRLPPGKLDKKGNQLFHEALKKRGRCIGQSEIVIYEKDNNPRS